MKKKLEYVIQISVKRMNVSRTRRKEEREETRPTPSTLSHVQDRLTHVDVLATDLSQNGKQLSEEETWFRCCDAESWNRTRKTIPKYAS